MIKVLAKDSASSLEEREDFIHELSQRRCSACVYLQTCDRVELYYSEAGPELQNPEVVRRLFRITAGLESPLIGENQIQHQVKQAYLKAAEAGGLNRELHLLFQKALMVGKRVRSETSLSTGVTSHAQAAVEIIKEKKTNLSRSKVVIIGVNHLNENIVRYLVRNDGETIFIANKSYEKALKLAQELDVYAFTFEELRYELRDTDILICATSAPHTIVPRHLFPEDKEMLIIDLAVPRDVEPSIGELPGVEIFTTPQIEDKVRNSIRLRRDQIELAEEIIESELETFLLRLNQNERRQLSYENNQEPQRII